jgi:NAD(P)-dependent dehydrogenase (short-subunit alcohol dehydrogenase family)
MKAIVTGHTRGLGAAIAHELLGRGVPVLGLARTLNDALGGRWPASLEQCELDLADPGALARWLETGALARFAAGASTLLLVNNAGTVQPVGPLPAQEPAAVGRAVCLNVAAPLMLSAALACATAPGTERRILHVSSGAARNAYPGWSVYCATKAALDLHAKAVALDATPALRVCSLAPGVVDTDMQAEIRATSTDRFPMRERFEAMKRDGVLVSAEDAARRLVEHLLGASFGDAPATDLRELAAR